MPTSAMAASAKAVTTVASNVKANRIAAAVSSLSGRGAPHSFGGNLKCQ